MKNLVIEKTPGRKQSELNFLKLQRKKSVIFIEEFIRVSPFPQQSNYETVYMFQIIHKFETHLRYTSERLNMFYRKPCSNELLWFMMNVIGKDNEKEIFY